MRLLIQTKSYRTVTASKDASKRIDLCDEKHLCRFCLEPITDSDREIRKCHDRCDQVLRRGVQSGKWTDEEQQQAGLWGAPERTGRPSRMPASITKTA